MTLKALETVTIPVPFGASAMFPLLPVIILNAPVSTILPVTFKLPPETLPVALIKPPVTRLPPVTLPVALTAPPVWTLPPVILPVVDAVPVVTVPVLLTSNTLAVPAELIVTLAFELTTTFDVPPEIEFAE